METEISQTDLCKPDNEDLKQSDASLKTKEKKFSCSFCTKILSSKQNLKEHEFTHTGELPYVCKYPGCGMRFRQGSVLSSHKRIHSFIEKYVVQDNFSFIKLTDLMKNFKEEIPDFKAEAKEKIDLPAITEPQEFFISIEYDD